MLLVKGIVIRLYFWREHFNFVIFIMFVMLVYGIIISKKPAGFPEIRTVCSLHLKSFNAFRIFIKSTEM